MMRNTCLGRKIALCSSVFFALSTLAVANTGNATAKGSDAQTIWRVETEQTGLLEIAIDAAWYSYDFGDQWNRLIVSDRLNNRVPFRIITPVAKTQVQQNRISLPIFFVNDETSNATNRSTTAIHLEHMGTRLSVESAAPTNPVKSGFYLIDLREVKSQPEILAFNWLVDEAHQFLSFSLASSDDLQHWQMHGDYTVTQLTANGKILAQNQIRLPNGVSDRAFLRLRFERNSETPTIHRIEGIIQQLTEEPTPDRTWQLTGTLADNHTVLYQPHKVHHHKHLFKHRHPIQTEKVNAWEFIRNELGAVQSLFVDFAQQSFVGELRVYSRNNLQANWRNQYADNWHHVSHGAKWYSSGAIHLHQNRDRYWRIEIAEDIALAQGPRLAFSGEQEYLQILANEFAPFTIAIDKAADSGRLVHMHSVFASLPSSVTQNKTTATVVLVTNTVIAPPTASAASGSWSIRFFWLLLIITSAVLLYFAYRLLAKEKNKP